MPSDPFSSLCDLPPARRVGVLSTYPPSHCGLATFSAALVTELAGAGDEVEVVVIDDGRDNAHWAQPSAQRLHNGVPASVASTTERLSGCDVVIIQHEYGIFGGPDGDEVLTILSGLSTPAIVVLHTVPMQPSEHQRTVLEAVCDLAARVVVMTQTAGERLAAGYVIDPSKLVLIPHGATPPLPITTGLAPAATADPSLRLLTWGLLGPGKGIEHVIEALSLLKDVRRPIRYTVAGATHPKVFARDGDLYRQSLIARSRQLGVSGIVGFDDSYRSVPDLMQFVAASSLVVLPYDSRDQVTSGVLVDAIAAGRPVIATAFPHARELLSDGAGIIVPHGDRAALAAAVRLVADDAGLLASMVQRARELAPSLTWSAVAAQYRDLFTALSPASAATV